MPTNGTSGHATICYPRRGTEGTPDAITTLVWARQDLPALIARLTTLYEWFIDEIGAI